MSNSEPSDLAERIRHLASSGGMRVGAREAGGLASYTTCVLALGRDVNLTAARTPEQAIEILVRPSLGVQAAWPHARPPRRAIDIGSGNGFPGVAVAASWPACEVVLVERRAKKAHAIARCIERAGFANAAALPCDAREIKRLRPDLLAAADLVTLRAVGSLEETTRLAAPLLAPGGCVVHWKKADLAVQERRGGEQAARTLGLEVLADVPQPASEGILVVYRRPAA